MREFNPLAKYPEPTTPRYVAPGLRTIKNRLLAWERGFDFFDGDRNNGYGGLKYDGRWRPIARDLVAEYKVPENGSILHLGCEKGFLLKDLSLEFPNLKLFGIDDSAYARAHAEPEIQGCIKPGSYTKLPFSDKELDLCVAIGPIYTLNLGDAVKCLREIERTSKRSFITLGAYEDEQDLRLLKYWSLLGTTVLHKSEWIEVLTYAGFSGDYKFVSAKSLNLVEKK